MKETSTPFAFYGKTEQCLPIFNVNYSENFQLFFCGAKYYISPRKKQVEHAEANSFCA